MHCDLILMTVRMYTPLYLCSGTNEPFTCDRMEAAVFSPCLAHVEDAHSVFDCKIVKLCLKWNQIPKHKELLLRFNYNLTTNPKRWHLRMKLKHPGC